MTQTLADFLEVFTDINKTIILLLLMVLGAFFRIKGYINGTEMVDFLKTITVSYFGTTAALNLTSMIQDHLATKLQVLKAQTPPKANP